MPRRGKMKIWNSSFICFICPNNELYDGGFDSTFFNANLFLVAAEEELKKPDTVGFGKKTAQPLWENTEFWRAILPKWFPGNDVVRFMRLIQALCIPRPLPFL